MRSYDDHLALSKRLALLHLDRGDWKAAFKTMVLSLNEHEELKNHRGIELGIMLLALPGRLSNVAEMRRFIEGFR